MSRPIGWGTVLVSGVVAGVCLPPAHAEHFDILLTVRCAQSRAEAGWDTSPPEGGFNPRQVCTARAGEDVTLEWRCMSEFPHGAMKKTTVRIFVAPINSLGQKALPPAETPRVVDNSFTTDFLPKHSARGLFHFRVNEPGVYLVRLESEETIKEHGHEHFAAVDLKVE